MKQYFDVIVLPAVKRLDETLKTQHISVTTDDQWRDHSVEVKVNYRFPNGSRKTLNASKIRTLKAIGVLPQ